MLSSVQQFDTATFALSEFPTPPISDEHELNSQQFLPLPEMKTAGATHCSVTVLFRVLTLLIVRSINASILLVFGSRVCVDNHLIYICMPNIPWYDGVVYLECAANGVYSRARL